MARGRRLALVLAALLALAGALVLRSVLSRRDPGETAGPELAVGTPSPADLPLAPPAETGEPRDVQAPEAGAAVSRTDAPGVEREPWARVFVEGTIRGAEGDLEHAVVIVRPGPLDEARRGAASALASWAKPGADGQFTVDVSRCFPREAQVHVGELNVQLSISGRLPVERAVAVAFTRAELAHGGELVVRADFELAATCRVLGIALHPDSPELALDVAAFSVRDGAPRAMVAITRAEAPSGRFALDLACAEEHLLVAFHPGFRPCTVRVPAYARDVGELRLERGASLSGRIVPPAVPPGARVAGRPRIDAGGPAVRLQAGLVAELCWIDGSLEWLAPSVPVDSEGRFELSGLAPGRVYALQAGASARERDVIAPASGLELAREGVPVFLRCEREALEAELVIVAPSGVVSVERIRLARGEAWRVLAELGSRVRVLDLAGSALGEASIEDPAGVELLIGP